MQNTINFNKPNVLQTLETTARAIALPHEYSPVRFPSFPALERTALMGFNSPGTLLVNAGYTTGRLMRQGAYPLWLDQPKTNFVYGCDYVFNITHIGIASTSFPVDVPIDFAVGNRSGSKALFAPGISGTYEKSIDYPILALDDNLDQQPFVFVPAGALLTFTVNSSNNLTSAVTASIGYEFWTQPGQTDVGFAAVVTLGARNGANTIGIVKNCWIRPTDIVFRDVVGNGTNFNMSMFVSNGVPTYNATTNYLIFPMTTTTVLLPFSPPAEFVNSTIPFSSTRTTAVAALFTNVSKVLNKEGTVLAGRLSPQSINIWDAQVTDVTNIHPAEKQFLGLEHGFYTYTPPSTDLATFWDYSYTFPQANKIVPLVRLSNTSLVNFFAFNDPDGGTNLAVNLDWHIEFRTTSALWQIGLSTMTLEAFHQAQLALVSAGFFFPNESHKADVKSITSKIGGWAAKLAPVAGAYHPMAGKGLKAASMMLSSKQKKTPNETTLQLRTKQQKAASAPQKKQKPKKKK